MKDVVLNYNYILHLTRKYTPLTATIYLALLSNTTFKRRNQKEEPFLYHQDSILSLDNFSPEEKLSVIPHCKLNLSQLSRKLKISYPTLLKHIKILEKEGLIQRFHIKRKNETFLITGDISSKTFKNTKNFLGKNYNFDYEFKVVDWKPFEPKNLHPDEYPKRFLICVSKKIIKQLLDKPNELVVYISLLRYTDRVAKYNGEYEEGFFYKRGFILSTIRQGVLADLLGLSHPTISRAIENLASEKLIIKRSFYNGRRFNMMFYLLGTRIVLNKNIEGIRYLNGEISINYKTKQYLRNFFFTNRFIKRPFICYSKALKGIEKKLQSIIFWDTIKKLQKRLQRRYNPAIILKDANKYIFLTIWFSLGESIKEFTRKFKGAYLRHRFKVMLAPLRYQEEYQPYLTYSEMKWLLKFFMVIFYLLEHRNNISNTDNNNRNNDNLDNISNNTDIDIHRKIKIEKKIRWETPVYLFLLTKLKRIAYQYGVEVIDDGTAIAGSNTATSITGGLSDALPSNDRVDAVLIGGSDDLMKVSPRLYRRYVKHIYSFIRSACKEAVHHFIETEALAEVLYNAYVKYFREKGIHKGAKVDFKVRTLEDELKNQPISQEITNLPREDKEKLQESEVKETLEELPMSKELSEKERQKNEAVVRALIESGILSEDRKYILAPPKPKKRKTPKRKIPIREYNFTKDLFSGILADEFREFHQKVNRILQCREYFRYGE